MSLAAKKFQKARCDIRKHSITGPAAEPDGGECGGAACLRRGSQCRRPAGRQAWAARPGGWRGPGCLRSRDIRTKALVAAVDCVGAIVRCASSPLTSAEQALLIGGLAGWQ